MLFPPDSINVRTDLAGNTSSTLATFNTTSTVLYESFNTASADANASLTISCGSGSVVLLRVNDFRNVPQLERFKFAKCPASDLRLLTSGTTGGATTTISVIYAPRDFTATSSEIATVDNFPDTTQAFLNTNYLVVLGIVLASILLLDLLRRLFMPRRSL